ncbi:MAG: methyltransferase [Saprospiraceae bacterium]|nr:methyltransferase [Saprospiraceae bacterium]MBK6565826.1 methyltransferase [Saprospiraceae bacterium]
MDQNTETKSVFQFKQFKIYQDDNVMKVNTDAILLASWCEIKSDGRAIDIGTGTGVIALILAQKNKKLIIDAIDIDENAFLQASENFQKNELGKNITPHHCSFQQFSRTNKAIYDVIVTNPPFFSDGPVSINKKKANFRHDITLQRAELLEGVSKLLSEQGSFQMILPYEEGLKCISMAENVGLYLNKCTRVYSKKEKKTERLLMKFSKVKKQQPDYNTLIIMSENGKEYSREYKELTKELYLFL